jgi:hypothetical protein
MTDAEATDGRKFLVDPSTKCGFFFERFMETVFFVYTSASFFFSFFAENVFGIYQWT